MQPERLAELEAEITSARVTIDKASAGVGRALREIRDGRLYKATHKSFAAYCHERWDLSRSHAYRLIDQAIVAENVSPIGDTAPTESQARALADLPAEEQRRVWRAATTTAPKRVTAERVRKVRAGLTRPSLAARVFNACRIGGCIIAAAYAAAACGGGL